MRDEFPEGWGGNRCLLGTSCHNLARLCRSGIEDGPDKREKPALYKAWIIDCGKNKFCAEISEQEQNDQNHADPVKGMRSSCSPVQGRNPAV